jgi:hypothetical protein
MKLNNILDQAASLFSLEDSNVEGIFSLDGQEFELKGFNIQFFQGVDHKGQPQNETRGGQLHITLSQSVNYNIQDWAKRSDKRKDGNVQFRTKTSGTVVNVAFFNANCVDLERKIRSVGGTTTTLVISPEKVSMNGVMHDNRWRE